MINSKTNDSRTMTENYNPIGRWDDMYKKIPCPSPYGIQNSYLLDVFFLDGLPLVEDWGCGTAFARSLFCKSKYVGIDGSKSAFCDVVEDLSKRRSNPDGILLRHVLEHNLNWSPVLKNAFVCAKSRLVLNMFTPLIAQTEYAWDDNGFACIKFARSDLLSCIPTIPTFECTVRQLDNEYQKAHRLETIFVFDKL